MNVCCFCVSSIVQTVHTQVVKFLAHFLYQCFFHWPVVPGHGYRWNGCMNMQICISARNHFVHPIDMVNSSSSCPSGTPPHINNFSFISTFTSSPSLFVRPIHYGSSSSRTSNYAPRHIVILVSVIVVVHHHHHHHHMWHHHQSD